MIVKVCHHLHRISDSSTKEETLSAIVSLATKHLSPVVDSLLECSAECDETLFTSSQGQYKSIARLARDYTCHPNLKKRAIGMAFYLEDLIHILR
ncbi:Hypothetical predicted protein [Podarcis lilfordi]|uniref:Maestro-like HEAT-repeats domain-containing protein n=1 Tax=Podarcis lilfordi TaxID=74358 RepID=A0AA35KVQ3_9SAUR|nr:Hypothetical predicted protein [Podarcis lilfordi]